MLLTQPGAPADVFSVTGEPIRERTVYRPRLLTWATEAITVLGVVYFAGELERQVNDHAQVGMIVLLALLLAALLVPALRLPLQGVVTTTSGLTIRNVLTTHLLSWEDVDHFEQASDYVANGGVAVLKDGRRIPMTAVQGGLATRFAARTVASLNQQLAERTGGTPRDQTADA